MRLNNRQLLSIIGGVKLSGALINAFARGLNTILDIGRSLGTAIVRIINKKTC